MKWKGSWIWLDNKPAPKNSYAYARKTFSLGTKPSKAIARICADSRYILWVNGRFVSRGPVRSDPRWQYFDEVDISKFLKRGDNVAAVLVHFYGEDTFSYHLGRAALLFDCTVESGKKKIDISSDSSWRMMSSQAWDGEFGRMDIQLAFSEIATPSREPKGWKLPGFDDIKQEAAWQPAIIIHNVGEGPWKSLVPREIPFLLESEIFATKVLGSGICDASGVKPPENDLKNIANIMQNEVLTPEVRGHLIHAEALIRRPNIEDLFRSKQFNPQGQGAKALGKEIDSQADVGTLCAVRSLRASERGHGKGVYLTLDFGREIVGFPKIKIASSQGGTVDIGYSETLQDGRVVPNRNGVKYADRVYLTGGPEEWQAFDKRAFRYMQVDFRDCPGPVIIETISAIFTTYPVQWRGWVETPDETLNETWKVCAYTVQLNMEDAFTDCPWRERTQWWGDARIEALANYYAFGDTKLIRQGLKQIAQSQHPDGITQCFYPGVFDRTIPGFTLIWIISIWDYYQWTGDAKTVLSLYDNVKRAIDWFIKRQRPDALIANGPEWNFYDWADIDVSGPNTLTSAFLAGALDAGAQMAVLAGDKATAKYYTEQKARITQATNTLLWDSEKGVYVDCIREDGSRSQTISQQANSTAILFGLAPKDKIDDILTYIHNDKNQVVKAGSPYFSFYLLQALWKNGKDLDALNYIHRMWGDMLDAGATTAWENWNPGSSLCHGWSSSPTHDFGAWLLGVQPAKPGFKTVTISPQTGGLPWARGCVPTQQGDILVSWVSENNNFTLTVDIPKHMKSKILLPMFGGQLGKLTINGKKPSKKITVGAPVLGRLPLNFPEGGKYKISFTPE